MKTYLRDELVRFLKGVDAALTRAVERAHETTGLDVPFEHS